MSDTDIQFGDIEHAAPEMSLRPDENRHFAVVRYGSPADGDLRVYVDMDVLEDMERHALEDTSVELGGVMLGGQYLDHEGRPFVVVSDSLRAKHYESGKGHFKFTHDTWSEISRERGEFSKELQMVGWYHTHPGWGVFLSGMDRFICDHFFNRPLDVAFVIDPVRDDRGWFYWNASAATTDCDKNDCDTDVDEMSDDAQGDVKTQTGAERLPRTAGFHVTASRFRRRELGQFVALLEGKMAIRSDSRAGDPQISAPRFHTVQPRFGWAAVAVAGMFTLQLVVTLLIATGRMPIGSAGASQDTGAALHVVAEKNDLLERRRKLDLEAERLVGERAAMKRLYANVRIDDDGRIDFSQMASENQQMHKQLEQLQQVKTVLASHAADLTRLETERTALTREVERFKESRDKANRRVQKLESQLSSTKMELAKAKKTSSNGEESQGKSDAQADMNWTDALQWKTILAVAAVIVVLAGGGVAMWQKRRAADITGEQSAIR